MGNHKILILTVLAGMGHIRAGEAIRDAVKEISPKTDVTLFNPLAYTNPTLSDSINRCYLWMTKFVPGLWGFLYDSEAISSKYSPLHWLVSKKYAQGISQILRQFKPTTIVCTHPFATSGVSVLKKEGFADLPLISVATDIDVHPFGIDHMVDIFIVPTSLVKEYLKDRGVRENKIKVCGIPVAPKSSSLKDKEKLRKEWGLKMSSPVVLILSGGFGIGPIEHLVSSFQGLKFPIQLVVVTGKDKTLNRRLEKRVNENIKVFGFLNNIEPLMEASDVVITKPGGLTTAEALTKGLPIVILKPIKGQESKNVDRLIDAGCAIKPERVEEIPDKVVQLLSNPTKLKEMQAASLQLGRPNSAIDIAKVLIGDWIKENGCWKPI